MLLTGPLAFVNDKNVLYKFTITNPVSDLTMCSSQCCGASSIFITGQYMNKTKATLKCKNPC